jgi:DNA-binding Lrp family transcriptional regulator
MVNAMDPHELEFRLLNDFQRDFPLVPEPYAELAQRLGVAEDEVLATLYSLQIDGKIGRVGAVFRPHVLGCSTLAAVSCPSDRLQSVAAMIDSHPEVNHNYEREHAYNLWFVVTATDRNGVAAVLDDIRRQSGLVPLDLPMLADYHIDLGFDLNGKHRGHRDTAGERIDAHALRTQLDDADYCLAAALESGLALTSRPYARLAASCGLNETECLHRIGHLLSLSVIRRFGIVVRHRELGFTANAMVVWDVPDERVEEIGQLLGRQEGVSLCYQRPRRLPEWRYNLFSMLHGRDRLAVLDRLETLRRELGLQNIACEPLFSRRRFKQCGAHYSTTAAKAA